MRTPGAGADVLLVSPGCLGSLQMNSERERREGRTKQDCSVSSSAGPDTHLHLLVLSIQERSKLQGAGRRTRQQKNKSGWHPSAPPDNLSQLFSAQGPPVPPRHPESWGTGSRWGRGNQANSMGRSTEPCMEGLPVLLGTSKGK